MYRASQLVYIVDLSQVFMNHDRRTVSLKQFWKKIQPLTELFDWICSVIISILESSKSTSSQIALAISSKCYIVFKFHDTFNSNKTKFFDEYDRQEVIMICNGSNFQTFIKSIALENVL